MQGNTFVTLLSDNMTLAQVLSDRLYSKTRLLSSVSRMIQMEEFGKLIDLGEDTVLFILREMWWGEIRVFWFPLLKRITGVDPVPVEERGRVSLMKSRWVAWGREHEIYGKQLLGTLT